MSRDVQKRREVKKKKKMKNQQEREREREKEKRERGKRESQLPLSLSSLFRICLLFSSCARPHLLATRVATSERKESDRGWRERQRKETHRSYIAD